MKDTKDRIIEAAIKLFAEKGFDGTSVDEISKLAKVNKAMIYYYFSSKERLLLSIMRKSVDEFTSIVESIDLSNFSDVKEMLEYIIREAINYVDTKSEIVKIFQIESIKNLQWRMSVIEMIGLTFDKVKEIFMKKFNQLIPEEELTIVEQVIFVNLIIGYLNIKEEIENLEDEVKKLIKGRYIKRTSEMIYSSIMGGEYE